MTQPPDTPRPPISFLAEDAPAPSDQPFFAEIPHLVGEWRGWRGGLPTFVYDSMTFGAFFTASLEGVKALLPSPKLLPVRVTPHRAAVYIGATHFRDTDVGAYHEAFVAMMVTIEKAVSTGFGFLSSLGRGSTMHFWQIALDSESASGSLEFMGAPKFLGEVQIDEGEQRLRVSASVDGEALFNLGVMRPQLRPGGRYRMELLSVKNGRILRWEIPGDYRERGMTWRRSGIRLELGTHPVGRQLAALNLRPLVALYNPTAQMVITAPVESYPA